MYVCIRVISDRNFTSIIQPRVQVTFLKNGKKSLPWLTSENLKNKRLEGRYLAGSHFWHPQGPHYPRGPYGCQKWPPARHPSSSRLFFKFSDVNLVSDFDPFWVKSCSTIGLTKPKIQWTHFYSFLCSQQHPWGHRPFRIGFWCIWLKPFEIHTRIYTKFL